jgi:hypothetical protein
MATRSGTPKFTIFRTAVRRRSCLNIPGTPAFSHASGPRFPEVPRLNYEPVERVDRPTKLRVPASPSPFSTSSKRLRPARRGQRPLRGGADRHLAHEVEVKLPGRFAVSPRLRAAINATPGVEDVRTAHAARTTISLQICRRRRVRIRIVSPMPSRLNVAGSGTLN